MTIPKSSKPSAEPETLQTWQTALCNYETALRALRQNGERKRDVVLRLDTLLYTQIPLKISSRSPCHITAREYVLIVEWKVRRGRWRHQALPFARMAKEKDVVAASVKAFRCLETGNIGEAFDALVPLIGCSPAVASAVLSVRDPSVPFLSVELVKMVVGEVKFFRETFLKVVECVRAKARQLSRWDEGRTWTAADVEKAIFVKMRLWDGLKGCEIGDIGEMICGINEVEESVLHDTEEIGKVTPEREDSPISEERLEHATGTHFPRRKRRSVRVSPRVEVVTGDVDIDENEDDEWFQRCRHGVFASARSRR